MKRLNAGIILALAGIFRGFAPHARKQNRQGRVVGCAACPHQRPVDLYLSDLNPRQDVADDEIKLLAQSLVACGLIQNLSGLLDESGKVGIVAGGRRLRALQIAPQAPLYFDANGDRI